MTAMPGVCRPMAGMTRVHAPDGGTGAQDALMQRYGPVSRSAAQAD